LVAECAPAVLVALPGAASEIAQEEALCPA
jgi:hypothetical protein